jgi:hypothetical protein
VKLDPNFETLSPAWVLFVGVAIAAVGLVFFYFETHGPELVDGFTSEYAYLASRAGLLFFVELVAWFFLKLYTSTISDLRDDGAIARHREETRAVIRMTCSQNGIVDLVELVKEGRSTRPPSAREATARQSRTTQQPSARMVRPR